MKTRTFIFTIALVLIVGAGAFFFGKSQAPEPEVKVVTKTKTVEKEVEKKINVSTEFVEEHLANIGKLATIEAQYMGTVTVEDKDGISYINKTGYSMLYTIDAQFGIEFDDIKIDVTETSVTVTLPEPKVLSRHADGTTLEFYDEKWAIFKSNELSDVPTAIAMAEEDFDNHKEKIAQYLDMAKQRAILSVHSLLEGVIGDKKLIVK